MIFMTTPITITEVPSEEEIAVRIWKQRQLVNAGFGMKDAGRIAARRDVDYHEAIRLLERGCAPEMAAKILL